jgi:hypothetical protein
MLYQVPVISQVLMQQRSRISPMQREIRAISMHEQGLSRWKGGLIRYQYI